MSIAAQCSDCCTCPQPTVEWDSRSASKTKIGFPEFSAVGPLVSIFLRAEISGGTHVVNLDTAGVGNPLLFCGGIDNTVPGSGPMQGATEYASDGSGTLVEDSTAVDATMASPCTGAPNQIVPLRIRPGDLGPGTGSSHFCTNSAIYVWTGDWEYSDCIDNGTITATSQTTASVETSGADATATLSIEYTTADLKTNTIAALPAYDDDWNDTAGSFANLSSTELSYAIRESRYRFRFKIPRVNTGLNYRVSWVERFIPEAGVGLTSIEVYSPGVYRPTVTLSAPPAGGTQARAVAVMSTTGTVSSIRILNPGAGYTSAPTVTVQAATGGGTTSTGWTATLSTTGGQVAAITAGSAGNYLPTLAFSGGGGSGATATCTMDAQGGIASVTLGAAGSGYTSAPTLSITAKVTGPVAADLLLHLGTETARCTTWGGSTLAGRWLLRAVADAGHAISSLEVVHGGNYLPTVTLSGGGGTGATAVVSGFSSDAKVTAITVTSGGSGYTSAPTVSITGRNGGSGATATASVSGGAVTGVTVGAQGNYRPTLTISGGGGTGATATVDLATTGEISAVNLTAAGSGYKTNPSLALSYYGTETILLAAHFGAETEFADGSQPAGALPVGYVDVVVRTYPILGDTGTAPWLYFEAPVPTADGTLLTANVRAVCEGSPCPP